MLTIPEYLPVLPARDVVAFPAVTISLYVGREASVNALQAASEKDGLVLLVAQRDESAEDPATKDLFSMGVVAQVLRTLQVPDGRIKVLLQGIMRVKVLDYKRGDNYLQARIRVVPPVESVKVSAKDAVVMKRIKENLQILVQNEHLPEELLLITEEISDPGILADVVLAHYRLEHQAAQHALEELNPIKRLKITDDAIANDLKQFFLSEKIRDKARDEMSKGQREYFLREQIKQIQRELGDEDSTSEDIAALKVALKNANMSEHARKEADKQLTRLERMSVESSEYALLRTYLEWFADLPWSTRSKDKLDMKLAKKVLDQDHHGLDKAKDRILEYLSVRKLNSECRGPILCFVGPPGVGKTSLGKSIARALGRSFVRMSLGGMRDEAEIRGHRRTYVGALPGRIIQGMKQAGSVNPVFVLDELDKVGADFRGDPASALLEVLDPAQNREFQDHYMNLSYDLSSVLFVATANTIDTIPDALLDRLEVIYLPGYTTDEKVKIAERFLVPRQLKENGLKPEQLKISTESLVFLIERYTREAGVRNLEREIGSLCRKLARDYAETGKLKNKVTPDLVKKLLGVTQFDPEQDERADLIGVARGLAWTMAGGEVMPVEVSIAEGSGGLNLTGSLGNVMQESAQAALFYARSNAQKLGLDPRFHKKLDIHVHVPGGATPKDGPSAGVTIATALVSTLSQRKISKDVAMTGEITLRGNVMPIGGLKEKALAALRYGIKNVIIPEENVKDLEEIPKEQRSKINFIPVKHISQVLEAALLPKEDRKRAEKHVKTGKRLAVRARA